jgi:hypothetical protein
MKFFEKLVQILDEKCQKNIHFVSNDNNFIHIKMSKYQSQ